MSDEIKELNGAEDNAEAVEEAVEEAAAEAVEEAAEEAAEEAQIPDAALAEELEQLRDTFQETLDETAAMADAVPAIQELDNGEEEPGEDEEEETSEPYPVVRKAKKKDGGKRKTGKIVGIVLGLLAVVVIGVLLCYVVLTVKNPNTTTYLSNIAAADAAEDYDSKISAYKAAINCCEDDNAVAQSMKSVATDKMLELMFEEKGFTEALGYIEENYDEEAVAATDSAIIKKIVGMRDAVKDAADKLVPAMFAAADENGEVDEKAVISSLGLSSDVSGAVEKAVTDLKEGIRASADAASLADYSAAGNSFLTAHTTLAGYGADAEKLAQTIAVELYNKGYIFESMFVAANLLSSDESTYTEEFAAVKKDAESIAKVKASVYELASSAAGKDAEAIAKLVKEKTKLDGAKLDFVTMIVTDAAEAIRAYKEKDMTAASEKCTTALSAEKAIGMDDAQLSFLYVKILYAYNISNAYSMAQSVMTDEVVKQLSDKQKEEYDDMKLAFDALSGTSEIFSEYYQSYYQSGTPVDFDAASKALDDYLTASANRYDKGFAAYCKYFAKSCSAKPDGAVKYLLEAKELIPEFVGFFAANIVDDYLSDNEIEKAEGIADEVLKVNKTDAYARSIKAFAARAAGDTDAALKLALGAADASSEINYCAYEAAVAYLLKEDLTSAADYAKKYYTSVSSSYNATYKDLVSACELITLIEGLYKGNDDLKKELTGLTDEITELYAYYQLTHLQDTVDILAGNKTVNDVFASGSFNFDFNAAAETETASDAQ